VQKLLVLFEVTCLFRFVITSLLIAYVPRYVDVVYIRLVLFEVTCVFRFVITSLLIAYVPRYVDVVLKRLVSFESTSEADAQPRGHPFAALYSKLAFFWKS
jgi:hypothetical protein